VHERAVDHGKFDIELLDLAKFNLPLYDEPTISRRAFTSCWAITGRQQSTPFRSSADRVASPLKTARDRRIRERLASLRASRF
jgi:hypothetical protein